MKICRKKQKVANRPAKEEAKKKKINPKPKKP